MKKLIILFFFPLVTLGHDFVEFSERSMLFEFENIQQNNGDIEFQGWLQEFEENERSKKNKVTVSIIVSIVLLFLCGRKLKLWLKAIILFITPLICAYALIGYFNLYIDSFGGLILLAIISLVVFIYILIQFFKVSPIGTALGLYVALKSDDKK